MKGRTPYIWNRSFQRLLLKLLVLVILVGPMDSHQRRNRKFSGFNATISNNASSTPLSTTTLVTLSQGSVRQRREIPDAMLDPYSVLGVLSFGVYIFYILYTRYRMRGHHNPSPQNNVQQPQGGGTLFSADAQENLANIIQMATNIISNAPYLGASNTTFDSDDYFDTGDGSDLRRKLKMSRK